MAKIPTEAEMACLISSLYQTANTLRIAIQLLTEEGLKEIDEDDLYRLQILNASLFQSIKNIEAKIPELKRPKHHVETPQTC